MRELVYRNINFPKANRREVSIEEIIRKNGFISRTLKKSRYFIQNIRRINSKEDFKRWMDNRQHNPSVDKKRFHIIKRHSDKGKRNKVLCKAKGTFYIIADEYIYDIVFIHSLNLEIKPMRNKKAG